MQADARETVVGGERSFRYFVAGSCASLGLIHGLGGAGVVWHLNIPELSLH